MTKLNLLLLFLILGASVEFAVRGPYRFLAPGTKWNDITYIYVPARAMIRGMDPYDPQAFVRACQCGITTADVRTHSTYPWPAYVLMAPLAILPWFSALYVRAGIQLILVISMVWALLSLAEPSGIWAGMFILFSLALACTPVWHRVT